METEVVGQFFDYEVDHGTAYLLGEQHFTSRSLIHIDKLTFI